MNSGLTESFQDNQQSSRLTRNYSFVEANDGTKDWELDDFWNIDYFGKWSQLSPIKRARHCLTLCGLLDQLSALGGGWNQEPFKVCEEYSVITNKW